MNWVLVICWMEVTTWLMFLSSSHYRLCSSLHYWPTMITLVLMFLLTECWLCLLVSCLHCCLCSTTTYTALLVFCDPCSALLCLFISFVLQLYCSACILWSMFYIALPPLLRFVNLCSTLLCLPSTFQCSTSLWLSPFQLTLVTPFTSCTLYHLPWSSGEPSLKTQRATS